jgi:DNA primase
MKRKHGGGNGLDFKAIREAVDLAALITKYQGQPRGRGRTARWLCPFHDDRHTPGLALTPDGQHFKCWTCNSSGDAIDFLAKVENIGKAEAALRLAGQPIGKPQGKPIGRKVGSQGSGQKSPRAYPTPEAALEAAERFEKKRHVATWVYQNLDRTEALRVSRFEGPSETSESGTEKAYRPFHRQAGGEWVIADPKGKLPLYRLPELVEAPAARVWIGEGEKVVDHAVGLGLVATTSAHGAQSPERTDWLPLAGRELVLMPDNNQAGEAYAAKVSQILADLHPRPTLRILRLAGLPEGGDLVEWLEAHDSWDETQCRQELERLADLVPPLDFNHAPSSNGFRSNGKPRG